MDKDTRKLLKLEDERYTFSDNWLTEETINKTTYHVIHGNWEGSVERCPHCHDEKLIKHGIYLRKIKMLAIYERPTLFYLQTRRYQCLKCRKTTSCKPNNIVKKYCNIADNVLKKALFSLGNAVTKKQIARELNISDATVHRVMHTTISDMKQNFMYLPEVLCIDEFKTLKTSNSKMNFIYVDGVTGEIIDILNNRQYAYLFSHFLKYPRKQRMKVKYVVMDMNAHYGGWVKRVFPNAEIVTDRFHIVQHINRTFDQLRRKVMNKYLNSKDLNHQKIGRRIKKYSKLLLKYEEDLCDKEYSYQLLFKRDMTETMIVNELLLMDEELKEAYEYTRELLTYYRQRNFTEFYKCVKDSINKTMRQFYAKFKIFIKYSKSIKIAFKVSYSNGVVEGINRKIKLLNRIVYGFRYFTYLRARILLNQGKLFTVK